MSQQKEATVIITSNIEKAFIFVGGEESKELYDSRIAEAEREQLVRLLEAEIRRVSKPMMVDREYLDGLEQAIAIIKERADAR